MQSALFSTFITLLITIGPVETATVFAGLTAGVHHAARRKLAVQAILIAGFVLLLFAVAGNAVLGLLHISLPAFRVAAGILLFLQALTLTFSSPGLSSISESEKSDALRPGNIAVFPLAFPLIAGPGALSAAVLLMGRAQTVGEAAGVPAMILICLLLTWLAMLAAEKLLRLLGETGADVVSRISGILLAALAVQFVFDGLAEAPLRLG
jgi:multiple antibiotic resistance protein